jgi:hypothetical protein
MPSTAVLTEDTTTIVDDENDRFRWGIPIAGAIAATATSIFLIALGSGIGLGLTSVPHSAPRTITTFLTLGGIYFFASQAFGFAVGGYLVGRLIGPEAENDKEEEFRAGAHGFIMWALTVVASLIILAASPAFTATAMPNATASGLSNDPSRSGYWVDEMFRPARNDPRVSSDKAEASRVLDMSVPGHLNDQDTQWLSYLVTQDSGLSHAEAISQVSATEKQRAEWADNTRKAASVLSLWTAFSLLFGAVVAVASAISARWLDDRISFSLSPRRRL